MTQPVRELFQSGFAMAFGILLDTFLIRPLLVPAVVRLLGGHALWPARPPRPERPAVPPAGSGTTSSDGSGTTPPAGYGRPDAGSPAPRPPAC